MPGSSFDDVVIGGVSLYDNLSGFKPTPSSASYLAQKLESAFTATEIREIKARIGIDYPGQSYLRQV
jgi:hypothetical protein